MTKEINGMYFEIIKPRNYFNQNVLYGIGTEDEIFKRYGKPSTTKQNIWKKWVQWANNTRGVVGLHISGANCNTFSIKGWYIEEGSFLEEDKTYFIWITKCHNKMYLVK